MKTPTPSPHSVFSESSVVSPSRLLVFACNTILTLTLVLPMQTSSQAEQLRAREWDRVRYALGAIESGNDDTAHGAAGEITRYQIRPENFSRFGGKLNRIYDESHAWSVTLRIFRHRMNIARDSGCSQVSPEILYLLWNAPQAAQAARYDFANITSPALRDRATRFANLFNTN